MRCTVTGYSVAGRDSKVVECNQLDAANLIAALMNGDSGAVADGTDTAATECRRVLTAALQPMRALGWPALATAFPLL